MKVSCEIIKDLLPLYHDDVCSDDSKLMVEEHLADCDSCKAELQAMDESLFISNVEQNLKEAEPIKRLSRKWKKGMINSLLRGIVIAVVVIALITLVLYTFLDIRIVIQADLLELRG
jgi:predicted anti-sigma-YlaC factor YlaD